MYELNSISSHGSDEGIISSSKIDPFLSVLVVNLDYCLLKTTITESFEIKKMPIGHNLAIVEPAIRIFGSTPLGQRTCVHIHGYYPFIYFRPENFSHAIFASEEKLRRYLPVFEKSIEDLLHFKRMSNKKNNKDYEIKRRKHVHHMEIKCQFSLYGMWSEKQLFVKVFLFDPGDITKLGSILQEGSLAGISMEVFESHIPYLLKFTSDFNVTTMGWLHLRDVRFRLPLPESVEIKATPDISLPNETLTPAATFSTPKKSPFSLASPFRSPLPFMMTTDAKGPNQLKVFNRSTIPSRLCWKPQTAPSSSVQPGVIQHTTTTGLKIEGNLDPSLLSLFEGLEEGDLFSQRNTPAKGELVTASTTSHMTSAAAARKKNNWNDPIDFSVKVSTCELEVDTHVTMVLNATMKRTEFGSELWEEERFRCLKKNLPMDKPPTLPSTQTVNRTQQQTEKDFYTRFERLQMKGVLLRKTAKQRISSQKDQQKAQVLSQYLTAEDLEPRNIEVFKKTDHSTDPITTTEEIFISQWASQTLLDAQKEAEEEEKLFQRIARDSDSFVEEYVKSQREHFSPSPAPTPSKPSLDHLKPYVFDQDGDDVETQESIDQEVENILSSTQVDETGYPLNKSQKQDYTSPNIHENRSNNDTSSKLPLPPKSPVIRTTRSSPISLQYETPSPDLSGILANDNYTDKFIDSTPSDDSSSMAVGIAAEEFQRYHQQSTVTSLVNMGSESGRVLGKRDLRGYKLTSVFKKPKTSASPIGFMNSSSTPTILGDANMTVSYSTPKRVKFADDITNDTNEGREALQRQSLTTLSSEAKNESKITGILRNTSDSKPVSSDLDLLERKKQFKKSVSFVTKAAKMNLETISTLTESLAPELQTKFEMKEVETGESPSSSSISESTPVVTEVADIESVSPWKYSSYQPTKPLYLIPTFTSPRNSKLKSLDSFELPLVINPKPRFTRQSDAKEQEKSLEHQQHNYHQYMSLSHRVVYERDVSVFKNSLSEPVNSSSTATNASTIPASVASIFPKRMRCLLPTFSPPDPEKFRKIICKERNDKPPSSTISFSFDSTYKDNTASTQSSDSNHFLLGSVNEHQEKMNRIVILSMELHCRTRKELLPNPKYDAIEAIVWVCDDIISNAENEQVSRYAGIFLCLPPSLSTTSNSSNSNRMASDSELLLRQLKMYLHTIPAVQVHTPEVQTFSHEIDLIESFCQFTRNVIDPDFLMGYESSNQSYGYLIKRGKVLNLNILQLLSRIPEETPSFRNEILRQEGAAAKAEGFEEAAPVEEELYDGNSINADVGIFIKGRTFLNLWHLIRSELKLWNHSIHYAVQSILEQTIPCFSHSQLTRWYSQSTTRYKTLAYSYLLALANLLLFAKLDLLRKISECARLYGIDFFSVFHRGSQYRVEASLLVKAHANDYLLLTPSKAKVANQAAMEVIPLVLEPKSHFYTDPVLVLDYQSLYPSMMLAYNLCYSTCMGKLKPGGNTATTDTDNNTNKMVTPETTGRLGVIHYPEVISAINTTLHVKNIKDSFRTGTRSSSGREKGNWKLDEDSPYVSPNGSIFCAKSVRLGILPRMIREMLDTRLMVKRAMKKHVKITSDGKKHNTILEKVLDARQLAIKLLANVTYGYTGAGFSGRMPMAELADAIVQSARSLLEWTIRTINHHPKWQAEVVYGDTDSVFVHLPGRSLEQAFKIGEEIAHEITSLTPKDVVLKFEKVYHPCLLLSKKRYVGNCYEYPPPAPEILSRVRVDPSRIRIPRAIESLPVGLTDPVEPYGKQTILSLLQRYQDQSKTNHYVFIDAKGIEMIRSDQCLLTQKIQKDVLILLFTTFGNLSLVKSYLWMKWGQIFQSNNPSNSSNTNNSKELEEIAFPDYIFYKEVRFGTYASASSQPPGAIVATKEVLVDEMAVPPYNWKVPYIVVYGLPNTPLKNLVYHPKEILKRGNHSLRINFSYYIMKCINPSLDRLLSLCGINIFNWFQSFIRPKVMLRHLNYDIIPKELLPTNSFEGVGGKKSLISLLPSAIPQQQQQQQLSMETFILQRLCLFCQQELARANKLICEKCFRQFQKFQRKPSPSSSSAIGKRSKNKVPPNSSSYSSSSSRSLEGVEIDQSTTVTPSFSEEDMHHFLSFQSRYRNLQLMDHRLERICNDCVSFDASYRCNSAILTPVLAPPSQQLQLFAKNELLGFNNCHNLSCHVFYQRLRLLLDLEDFLLVQYELQL